VNTLRSKPIKRINKKMTFATLPDTTGRRKRKEEALPMLPAGDDFITDTTDDFQDRLAAELKDDHLARKVISLMNNKHPYGTVPELIMLDFLEQKGERYKYQAQLYGGWRSGGLIPDFVVSRGGQARALLINGNYWHNVPGKREKDAADKLRILNSYFDGERISAVTIVWESRLMGSGRNAVMQDAIVGIEHPG
jgi:hypothetical protein